MADTPALEAGEGNLVEVQVLSPAFSFFDIFLIFANIPLIERCSHGIILFASLAQLVEQLPLKEMVGGSNPSRGITCYIFCLRWDSIFLWKIPRNDFGHSVRVLLFIKFVPNNCLRWDSNPHGLAPITF